MSRSSQGRSRARGRAGGRGKVSLDGDEQYPAKRARLERQESDISAASAKQSVVVPTPTVEGILDDATDMDTVHVDVENGHAVYASEPSDKDSSQHSDSMDVEDGEDEDGDAESGSGDEQSDSSEDDATDNGQVSEVEGSEGHSDEEEELAEQRITAAMDDDDVAEPDAEEVLCTCVGGSAKCMSSRRGVKYYDGDFVYTSSGHAGSPHYLCQVVSIHKPQETNVPVMEVQWFYRREELSKDILDDFDSKEGIQ